MSTYAFGSILQPADLPIVAVTGNILESRAVSWATPVCTSPCGSDPSDHGVCIGAAAFRIRVSRALACPPASVSPV